MSNSYIKARIGAGQRVRELLALYRFHSADLPQQVANLVRTMQEHQGAIERSLGAPLRGKTILEIGPGQMLRQARFFGAHNHVIAVDLDEVAIAWHVPAWWRMLRKNGPVRFFKTLARKAIGIDRRFVAELVRQMPSAASPSIDIVQCDAAHTELESGSFDAAVSFSVLEHIPEPRLIMREVARLLRPGGVSYHVIHNYTSDSGAHDPRSFIAGQREFPYWCHLRADTSHMCAGNAYVNMIPLAQWKRIAREEFQGVEIRSIVQYDSPQLADELRKLRARGELLNHSDEELLTVCLVLIWVKPAATADTHAAAPGHPEC